MGKKLKVPNFWVNSKSLWHYDIKYLALIRIFKKYNLDPSSPPPKIQSKIPDLKMVWIFSFNIFNHLFPVQFRILQPKKECGSTWIRIRKMYAFFCLRSVKALCNLTIIRRVLVISPFISLKMKKCNGAKKETIEGCRKVRRDVKGEGVQCI